MLVTAFNVTMTLNAVNNIFKLVFGGRGKCPEEGSALLCNAGRGKPENRECRREQNQTGFVGWPRRFSRGLPRFAVLGAPPNAPSSGAERRGGAQRAYRLSGAAGQCEACRGREGAPRSDQRKRPPPELNFDYEGLDVFLVRVQQTGLPGEGITLVMRRKGFAEWVLVGVRL